MLSSVRGVQRRPPTPPSHTDPEQFIHAARGATADAFADVLEQLAPLEEPGPELKPKTFNLRLPPELHAKLEALSEKTGRSMHEILMTFVAPGVERAYERYCQ